LAWFTQIKKERQKPLMTTITNTKEFAVSKTQKTVLTITGFVALELLLVYGLIPVGVTLWQLIACSC